MRRLTVIVAWFLLSAATASADVPSSTFGPMTALAPLPGDFSSDANAVNGSGLIVGHSEGPTGLTAVYWRRDGVPHAIRPGRALGVNEAGKIVLSGSGRGWVFDPSTVTLTRLGTLDGGGSNARAINDLGEVAGNATVIAGIVDGEPDVRLRGAFWPADRVVTGGVPSELPTLGGPDAFVYAMNGAGEITGQSSKADDGIFYPVLWRRSGAGFAIVELPNEGGGEDYGRAINDKGQVAGVASLLPFVWETRDGISVTQLRAPAALGGPRGVANGINKRSEMVGFIGVNDDDDSTHVRAVWWRNGGKEPVYLGTLGGDESFARAISDVGVVVGLSSDAAGNGLAFVIWRD